MKKLTALALAAVLLPLGANATSLKLPALNLQDGGAALTQQVGDQFYQVAVQTRDTCLERHQERADARDCYYENYVINSDAIYAEMGVSQDATAAALIDVMKDKQNPQNYYATQQAGYADMLMTTISAIQSPKVSRILVDKGYLSQGTINKL